MDQAEIRISPSKLVMPCRVALYYEVIEKRKRKPSVKMIAGTAVHAAQAADLRVKVQTGAVIAEDEQIEQIVSDAFDAEHSKRGIHLDPDDRERNLRDVLGEMKDLAIRNALLVHARLTPTRSPVVVENIERRITLRIRGTNIVVVGVVDLYEPGDGGAVWDTKLKGSSKPGWGDIAGNVQLAFYVATIRLSPGDETVETVGLDWLQQLNAGPVLHTVECGAPTDNGPLLRRVELLAKIIETGLFEPVDPTSMVGSWACTEKFCAHFGYCPFGQARRVSMAMRSFKMPERTGGEFRG